jgi:hypothetical protein
MPSKRAAIFKTVLEYVNSDDWVDMGEFLVFGKAAFEAHIEGDDLSMNKNTRELANKLKTNRGVREVVSRTSMRQPPKDNTVEALTDFGKKLPETTLRNILAVLDSQGKSQPSAPIDSDDAIDAALALTLIENLGKAAQRVQSLDSVEFHPRRFIPPITLKKLIGAICLVLRSPQRSYAAQS